jgi:hypothetical protein
MQVALTQPAHSGSLQHLIALGLVYFVTLDGHRLTWAMENSGFQFNLSC